MNQFTAVLASALIVVVGVLLLISFADKIEDWLND